jgi:ABC-type transport system involved in cytochrome c biogenesis permease subunit
MKKLLSNWRTWLPWAVLVTMAFWVIGNLQEHQKKSPYNINEFAKLPVLLNGRIQPFDSVAQNTLRMLRGKSTVVLSDKPEEELGTFDFPKKMPATEWLLEVMTRPEDADTRPVFRIDNLEVLGLLHLPEKRKYFSFNEVEKNLELVREQVQRLEDNKIKEETRTPFEKGVVKFDSAVTTYFRLKNSLRPQSSSNFGEELATFQSSVKPGLAALQQYEAGAQYNTNDLQAISRFLQRYQMLGRVAYPLVIPPEHPEKSRDNWQSVGASLMESIRTARIDPAIEYFSRITTAYGAKQPEEFNRAVAEYKGYLQSKFVPEIRKGTQETFFNHYAPFIKSIALYLMAFLFGCAYWFNFSPWARRTSFFLQLLALVVHTSGLIFRMYLERRPPVTNLYSSAIFVGWGAVILGSILERVWKNGIGVVTASAVGVVTLIIAHNLALGGDTMEMLRAVLDTNFWLATHVVVITLGYASMFVAGFLALIYIVRGLFTTTLDHATGKSLSRMVYGIVCFATLFSFVGTILGGIWADQSWGRFWGWDPKENGALLIVLWSAIVLHARWGGLIRDRGLMAMAIFGNIVTSFSWFGVNMLGVGLHSYGFMDKAFQWLRAFDISQVALICLALIPLRYWRSFKKLSAPAGPSSGTKAAAPKEVVAVKNGMPLVPSRAGA